MKPMRKYYAEVLELATTSMDEIGFKEAFAQGQAISIEEAISYARQALATF